MPSTLKRGELLASLIATGVVIAATLAFLLTRGTSPAPPPPIAHTEPAAAQPEPPATRLAMPENPATNPTPIIRASPGIRTGTLLDISKEPSLADLKPTLITVDIDDQPAEEACNILSFASAIAIVPSPAALNSPELPHAALHLKDTPFLEALLELRDQLGATTGPVTPNQITFTTMHPNTSVGHWCIAGPFAIIFQSASRTIDLSTHNTRPSLITLELLAEPQLSLSAGAATARIDEFLDDKGRTISTNLAPAARGFTPGFRPAGSIINPAGRTITIPYQPPADGHRIALLRGALLTAITTQTETLQASLSEIRTYDIAGCKAEVQPATLQPNTAPPSLAAYQFQIRFLRADLPQDRWTALRSALSAPTNRPRVLNSADQPFTATHAGSANGDPDSFTLTYLARGSPNLGEPHHLLLDLPSASRDVTIPFEFHDLILP